MVPLASYDREHRVSAADCRLTGYRVHLTSGLHKVYEGSRKMTEQTTKEYSTDNTLSDDWSTEIAHTVEEIEAIRPIWEAMQAAESYPSINADIDRCLSVLEALGSNCRPLVLLLKQNGYPRAMVVGRLQRHAIPIRLGYMTLLRPKLQCLSVVYGGVLGQPDEHVSLRLLRKLMSLLRRENIDCIYFNHLRVQSAIYKQVHRIPSLFCRNHLPTVERHWRMSIPKNLETLLASRSKNTRKDLRRTLNRVTKSFPERLKLRVYDRPEQAETAFRDMAYINRNSYHLALADGVVMECQQRLILEAAARQGWMRLYILYIDNQPVAYEYILKCHRVCYAEATAYHPAWQRWNIGTFIILKAVENLCSETEVSSIDFGFGDARYKKSLCDESWLEGEATYLFAPRIYPLLVNSIYGLNSVCTLALRSILRKTRLFARVKRIWRQELQPGDVQQV